MTNLSSLSGLLTPICYRSFVIGHLTRRRHYLGGREKKCIAGFQPAKVVLTQKELSRLRCRRDAGATTFSHDPCLRGETGCLAINLFTRGGLLRPRLPARSTLPNRGWRGEGRSRLPRAQPKSAPRSLLALRRVAATLPPCTARTPLRPSSTARCPARSAGAGCAGSGRQTGPGRPSEPEAARALLPPAAGAAARPPSWPGPRSEARSHRGRWPAATPR